MLFLLVLMEIGFIIIESSSAGKEEGISIVESIDDTKDVVSVHL